MNPKIIFFDIDGTLWDEEMTIPESTKLAIMKAKRNGHKLFLCSGRAKGNIYTQELLNLEFDGIIASCGNYIEMNGQVLYEYLLSEKQLQTIIDVTERNRMPIVIEGAKKHWISEEGFDKDPYVESLFRDLGEDAVILNGYSKDIVANKFSAVINPDTNYQTIKKTLQDEFDFLEHVENIVEVIPKGTSKGSGIQWLCEKLGIPLDDAYAFGDSVNDLDMLKTVGHGIAMGNASEPAKSVAEYVTDDIHKDGIYNALIYYGLIF